MYQLVAALATVALLLAGRPLPAQGLAYRFEIMGVTDSTFAFEVGAQGWVAPRMRGVAVDPRRRDALIAQFEIATVTGGIAMARVTGQTSRVSTDHVALLERPERPWYRRAAFWAGALLGLVIGAAAGSV